MPIASFSVSKVCTVRTGPKISSWAIFAFGSRSVKMVGSAFPAAM